MRRVLVDPRNQLPGTLPIGEELILGKMVDLAADGSLWLDQAYFDYATGLRMANEPAWERLFGFPRREAESEMRQEHCDLALAIQR